MKQAILTLLTFALLLLNSCIDGEEEIFLHSDGSARLKAVYTVPVLIFSDEDAAELEAIIAKEIGDEKDLELVTNTVAKVNGKQVITIELKTDNVVDLEGLLDDHDDPGEGESESKSDKMLHALVGKFVIEREGLQADIHRKVDLAPLLEQYMGKRGVSLLGDSEFRYTIHFPHAVDYSNAHEVLNEGKTLKWRYKLAESKTKPIELVMVATVPLPWWLYAAAGSVLVVLLLLLWSLIRRLRA
ncbi:hypothetical protein JO972_14155 [Verrucomicrobiaceae bacterium 5K15]|uniref:DUF3153 domain-containing protein n=1 Tax=Oceaniferula flava TaxID=2800421 RepID=A0AAE2SDA1_9BACT|nr:hypothetical protein [Oceaniferula flavus]MBK1856111.1 hypothetical protein [Oceaniferula flavus]MBM1137418.1 hypothetical protein [Oceaniferula flavus]